MTANYELNETDSPPTPTSTTGSAPPRHLTEAHRQHLRDSGLTDETIARRGFFSCDDAEGRRILHWSDSVRGNASGLVIPYPNVLGYAKIRTDRPRPLSGEWPAAANVPHQDCGCRRRSPSDEK